MFIKLFLCLFVFLLTFFDVNSRIVPFTPCPNLFNYYETPTNDVFGMIKIENNLSGVYKLEVNMSIALVTNRNIVIRRMTSERDIKLGKDIEYLINFPFNHTFPLLTSISINDVVYCTGPGEERTIEHGVTILSTTDYFRTNMFVVPPGSLHPDSLPPGSFIPPGSLPPGSIPSGSLPSGSLPPGSLPSGSLPSPSIPSTTNVHIYEIRPIETKPTTNSFIIQAVTSLVTTTEGFLNNRVPSQITTECGLAEDTRPLIFNGKPTRSGQYPWLTAIFHLEEDASYKFRCAGSLVTNKHVITAAHCVQVQKTISVRKENLVLVLGKHNIKSWALRSTIRDVQRIYVHPDFNAPGDADVAILRMHQTVEYTTTLRPVCLWNEDDVLERIISLKGTVVGWGRDEADNDFVEEPRQIDMPVVTQESCLRADDRFLKLTSNRTFCAGDRNGQAPCSGDSGGGFLMRKNGRWMLRGIVSVALVDSKTQSCDVNNYVVFSDVPKYGRWINSVLKK